ncbi:MAG: DUF4350 domain-containing protein [Polyangiaceae bacterium]|nr:DUF4350 domain-containing protein [Polyangiaceae bacterium]
MFATLIIGILAGILTILSSTQALAIPYGFEDNSWEGCSTFIHTLKETIGNDKVITTSNLKWGDLTPYDGLIVIYPLRPLHSDELSAFLRSGGRVAIIDDFGASEENLQRFQINRVPAPTQPARMLRNNPALAIAEPIADTTAGRTSGVHPAVASASTVVTNHPSALTHPNLTSVLRIQATGEPDGIIAVAGQVGKGRLFAVSDGSVVINQMLRYPGNRGLAQGIGAYLIADDTWGERNGKIYVVARKFEESGAFGNQSTIAKSINAFARDQRQRIAEARATGLSATTSIILGALAGLIGLIWIGNAAARSYQRKPPEYARPLPIVMQGGVAGRTAVLAAPTTNKALVLLELKSALEEAIANHVNTKLPLSAPDIQDTIERLQILDEQEWEKLKKLLLSVDVLETAIATGNPLRVRDRDVRLAAEQVHTILARINEKGRTRAHVSSKP